MRRLETGRQMGESQTISALAPDPLISQTQPVQKVQGLWVPKPLRRGEFGGTKTWTLSDSK